MLMMQHHRKHTLIYVVLAAASLVSSYSYGATDPNAAVVEVRKTCLDNGVARNNCFTDFGPLKNWINTARLQKPSSDAPLKVEIGPGTFGTFSLTCNASSGFTGYISFVGAGVGNTVILSPGFGAGLKVQNCTELGFSDLSIGSVSYGGVTWSGGGNSSWNNVHIFGPGNLWYADYCGASKGKHYWTSSRITATAGVGSSNAYYEVCDESWFFGSELTASVPQNTNGGGAGMVTANQQGEIHIYGSVLRALIDGNAGSMAVVSTGIDGGGGGSIHIHGTGIDAISNTGKNLTVLSAANGGHIHANVSSYFIQTTGSSTRIVNNGGHIHAPYQWEHIPDPDSDPATPSGFTSVNGADMTTISTGTSDGKPHLIIYSADCPADTRWYDAVDKVCR